METFAGAEEEESEDEDEEEAEDEDEDKKEAKKKKDKDEEDAEAEEESDEEEETEDEEEADELMTAEAAGTIVSFVVAPFDPQPGSYCYKMLIDTQAHKLYYYKRHRISEKAGAGFLPEDISKITASRVKK